MSYHVTDNFCNVYLELIEPNKGLHISLSWRRNRILDISTKFSIQKPKTFENPKIIFQPSKCAIENLLRILLKKVIADFLEHVKPSQFNLGHRFGGRESNIILYGEKKNYFASNFHQMDFSFSNIFFPWNISIIVIADLSVNFRWIGEKLREIVAAFGTLAFELCINSIK